MSVTARRANKADARTIAEYAIKLFAQHREYDRRRFAEIASFEGAENFYGNQTEIKGAAVLVAEFENKISVSLICSMKRWITRTCSKTPSGFTIYTLTNRRADKMPESF